MSKEDKTLKPKTKTNTRTEDDGHSHFYRLVPNILTLSALAAGLSSIQFAIDGRWEAAVIAIVTAGILDVLDGASARLLNATSEFGAQLDSLSDFLAFGIAPSIVLYLWILEESGKIGWIAMLVFAVATAMRLARFNITSTKPKKWAKGFFEGTPAPAGAGTALLPLFIWLNDPEYFGQFSHLNIIVGIWVLFCAALMVSRIPTWSSKQIHIPKKMTMPALGIVVLIIAALIQAPWISLSIISLTYLTTIPFSIRHYKKLAKEHEEQIDLADLALGISEED